MASQGSYESFFRIRFSAREYCYQGGNDINGIDGSDGGVVSIKGMEFGLESIQAFLDLLLWKR